MSKRLFYERKNGVEAKNIDIEQFMISSCFVCCCWTVGAVGVASFPSNIGAATRMLFACPTSWCLFQHLFLNVELN
jgi:hypothetical protein